MHNPKTRPAVPSLMAGKYAVETFLCLALADDAAVLTPGLALVKHPLAVGGPWEGRLALGEGDGDSHAEQF